MNIFSIINKIKVNKEKVAIFIDIGGIGDYSLNREYFKYIKKSPVFKGLKVIYLAKEMYSDMVSFYDSESFDEIIKFETSTIRKRRLRKRFLRIFDKYDVEILVNLRAINSHEEDWHIRNILVREIKAKQKFVERVSFASKEDKHNNFKIYNNIIEINEPTFQGERRRKFFEELLKLEIPYKENVYSPILKVGKNYIAISIFSLAERRELDKNTWVKVVNYLTSAVSDNTEILLLGSRQEKKEADDFIKLCRESSKIRNLAGVFPISMVPTILANCKLLVSVESGNVHIAHAVGCRAVCISNGSYYGRYLPYQDDIIAYVFPDEFEKYLQTATEQDLLHLYNFVYEFDINAISSEKIIQSIKNQLSPEDKILRFDNLISDKASKKERKKERKKEHPSNGLFLQ